MRQSRVRNQHLIALFNGVGFVVVKDCVFKAVFSAYRKDVNLLEQQVPFFLAEFIASSDIPVLSREPVTVGPIPAVRRLNIQDRSYEIWVHVFQVPEDCDFSSAMVVSFFNHQLSQDLDVLLYQAQQQLQQKVFA